MKLRRADEIWRPFLSQDTIAVLAAFKAFDNFEPSGFIGLGDAMAFAELQSLFRNLGTPSLQSTYSTAAVGGLLKRNLIVIGGPDGNAVASEALASIGSTFEFDYPAQGGVAVRDALSPAYYEPRLVPGTNSGHDFGLVLRTSNPFSPEHQLLLIAGCYGFGTWGGARFLVEASQRGVHNAEIRRSRFECLVRVNLVTGIPQTTQLEKFRIRR